MKNTTRTNADKIREMTDAQLAEFIGRVSNDDAERWYAWLKKEAVEPVISRRIVYEDEEEDEDI